MPVDIDVDGATVTVHVDGAEHRVDVAPGTAWRGVGFEQPGPLVREYQIDGSDTTSTLDRQPRVILRVLDSPLYRLDSWLRDESSFSRWEQLRILDAETGQAVPTARSESETLSGARTDLYFEGEPPRALRIEAVLRRPESAARLWLLTSDGQQGLELDRDRRNARWLIERGVTRDALPRWFFPEQPAPFAAELVHLLGRAAAAGYAVALVTVGLGWLLRRVLPERRVHVSPKLPLAEAVLAAWLLAAALITTRLYHQLPHILDAVSYSFQAGVLRAGLLWLPAPDMVDAFRGPFEVVSGGRWFSQYPPGAPLAYALGGLAGLEWLVGPLACVVLIGSTAWSAGMLYGRGTGQVVLLLGALSPFILFQAGSFLSHPIAGGLLAAAMAAFVAAERTGRERWYAATGALLGYGFLTREAASVLFALPLLARIALQRRWQALAWIAACGLPFLLIYLVYNQQLTGNPLLLPRAIFDPSDRFGFGDGIGFHRRHTLAAGLANTDELLTLLQLDLFGWPPLFALGLLGLPFLLGRARVWDVLAGCGVLAFAVAYVAYFYHGIALGPRYYFEALPWLLLLGGRGLVVLAEVAHSRVAAGVVVGALSLNTVLFYMPAQVERRTDFSAIPENVRNSLAFVRSGVFGPRLDNVPTPSLIVTSDWWLFNTSLAALNCPQVPDCSALFALATTPEDVAQLRAAYPGRIALRAVRHDDRVDLEPD